MGGGCNEKCNGKCWGGRNAGYQARWRAKRDALGRGNSEVVERALMQEVERCERDRNNSRRQQPVRHRGPTFSIRSFPIVQALGAGAEPGERLSARNFPMKTVLLAAATKEAIRVAQNLLANERIGIRAHHDGVRLVA